MSTGQGDPGGARQREPTEEELRAAYEAEIKQVRVEHVLLEQIVTLVNLGMRRTGLAPGTESERDAGQVRVSIEAVRALLPLLEQSAPQQVGPIREALSQLQLAFVRIGGAAAPSGGHAAAGAPGAEGAPEQEPSRPGQEDAEERARQEPAPGQPGAQEPSPGKPGEAGPAQRSGRLWVPGQ
jgi:hypothetical protein